MTLEGDAMMRCMEKRSRGPVRSGKRNEEEEEEEEEEVEEEE